MLRRLAGVDHLGGNCPVQGFGRVGDKGLYFRSRGEWWTVDIGSADSDYVSEENAIFSVAGRYGEWPSAGWMPLWRAAVIIRLCRILYRILHG